MDTRKITGIDINCVKGIDSLHIDCEFFPNKPNFLVAPNGSGKSSLATAFASLNRNRLKLDKNNYRRGTDGSAASLTITLDDGESYSADSEHNDIFRFADVHVINSGLYAHATKVKFPGGSGVAANIKVPDQILWKQVPQNSSIDYSVSKLRKRYPAELRPMVFNLQDELGDMQFLNKLVELPSKSMEDNSISANINTWFKALKLSDETSKASKALLRAERKLLNVGAINKAFDMLKDYYPSATRAELILNAIEMCRLRHEQASNIKKHLRWLEYKNERARVDKFISALDTTGQNLKLVNKRGSVLLQLPDRSQISNGELDILNFAIQLIQVQKKSTSKNSVLIIDEVFDYLDDANLLVAQFYLSKMMQQYKEADRSIYIVLLTHMDPYLMASYRFKVKHVSFFAKESHGTVTECMTKLIRDRVRCKRAQEDIYNDISARYLHYSPYILANSKTEAYLQEKGFPSSVTSVAAFATRCREELDSYLGGGKYDILMSCCALRRLIEKSAFDLLNSADQQKHFLETEGTIAKLDYASECGADIPEIHLLLSGVYNTSMHLKATKSDMEIQAIGRKMDNLVIRSMIRSVASSK